jgi:hypothetical protein
MKKSPAILDRISSTKEEMACLHWLGFTGSHCLMIYSWLGNSVRGTTPMLLKNVMQDVL